VQVASSLISYIYRKVTFMILNELIRKCLHKIEANSLFLYRIKNYLHEKNDVCRVKYK